MTITRMMKWIGLASVVALTACTSQEQLLPTNGNTMQSIWDQGAGSNPLLAVRQQTTKRQDEVGYVSSREQQSYTRTAANETTNLFPRLPNPDLVMYVYPHLSRSGEPMPVPGYTTVIPFYGRVQYAQPGERTRGL